MTSKEFLGHSQMSFSASPVPKNPYMADNFNGTHWKCRFVERNTLESFTTYFSQGIGHGRKKPKAEDVLLYIAWDISSIDAYSFEEWAENLGLSADSIKALAAYNLIQDQRENWRSAFGAKSLSALLLVEED